MPLVPVGGKYEGIWQNELKNGDIAYYINYRNENNVPVKKKVGTKTKQRNFTVKDAYDKLIEIKHKLNIGEELPLKEVRTKRLLFSDAWGSFIDCTDVAESTKNEYKLLYEKHLAIFAKKELKSLKTEDFEEYKREKFKIGYAEQTVTHMLGLARQIINHAIAKELIKNHANPIANGKVKMPKVDNARLDFLTKKEAKNLLHILREEYENQKPYYLAVFALYTGARLSEITNLTWQNINFETGKIYYPSRKNGNARWVIMTEIVKSVLNEIKDNTEHIGRYVFFPKREKDVRKDRAPDEIMPAIEKIRPGNKKLEDKYKISFHSFRHTHASWLAMAGLGILHIKEQLGHKTLEMVLRYAHLAPNERDDITKSL